MDVSIAVSLIRGQMRTVVERAVSGAVETVLAEMLRIVGVKFDDLKGQVATLQHDMAALQKEKALKEKENDKIRAMLRYTELKLKYYRQGVEQEMQYRASNAPPPRGDPNKQTSSPPARRSNLSASAQSKTVLDSSQASPSPQNDSRLVVRAGRLSPDDAVVAGNLELPEVMLSHTDQSDALPGSLATHNGPTESLENLLDSHAALLTVVSEEVSFPAERGDAAHGKKEEVGDWMISLQTDVESVAPSPGHAPLPPDSSARPCPTPPVQVKEEGLHIMQEVISIKEEPEEEQEVVDTLLDRQRKPESILGTEGQSSHADGSGSTIMQRTFPDHMTQGFNFMGSTSYALPRSLDAVSSLPGLPDHLPHRQGSRPWPKELSLYEEYKLRRNELQRRSLNRRREMEKNLPQPLLADLIRERREKTRLRVARWRAKRKLQAHLNQAQAQGGAVAFSQQQGLNIPPQQEQHAPPCGGAVSASSPLSAPRSRAAPPTHSNNFLSNNMLPSNRFPAFMSSASLMMGWNNMADHNQHAVTSSTTHAHAGLSQQTSSSTHAHAGLSQQSSSLTDTDIFQ